jgi:glyoxylase-like metal-dependent hydrolase (beta-lactamase superfamily II)
MTRETGYICTMCGIHQTKGEAPLRCIICDEERQYVNPEGQTWTSMEKLNHEYKNIVEKIHPGLYAIYSIPGFGIGQRAYLIITPGGNILWDCISNLDQCTISMIESLGGVSAIAISHPHFYSTMSFWSAAFGDVPVYLNKRDSAWVLDDFSNIIYWESQEFTIWEKVRLIHCGGHFAGSTVLYNDYRYELFTGDSIYINPDLKSISCMYSYPNLIPLKKHEILQIQRAVSSTPYKSIYGAFGKNITSNARDVVAFSLNRYLNVFK